MYGKKGLVSCVTPVYNGEKYLAFMLESVLNQTYPLVEMILVDDGSTDQTLEVAESYREKFAKKNYTYHIIRASHKCASAAINQGLPLVTGEYLIWPDSDDLLEPESVKTRVEFLEKHSQYKAVRSIMYYFDEKGRLEKGDEKLGELDRETLFFDILETKTFVCCGCYMFQTEEFFSIYPERQIPEYSVGQNFQMLLPYLYRYSCHTIPEKLYGVRVHQDSHSRRAMTQEEEEQRFRDFERLIDEVSNASGIRHIKEKIWIRCWKLWRRRKIALKYGRRKESVKAKLALMLYGRIKIHEELLKYIRYWLGLQEEGT